MIVMVREAYPWEFISYYNSSMGKSEWKYFENEKLDHCTWHDRVPRCENMKITIVQEEASSIPSMRKGFGGC